MTALSYVIDQFDSILTDGQSADWWLHDVTLPEDSDELHIQALVASGDYFETLAARLEQIAAKLPVRCAEQHQLQEAVSHLLYLQRGYKITKRGSPQSVSTPKF